MQRVLIIWTGFDKFKKGKWGNFRCVEDRLALSFDHFSRSRERYRRGTPIKNLARRNNSLAMSNDQPKRSSGRIPRVVFPVCHHECTTVVAIHRELQYIAGESLQERGQMHNRIPAGGADNAPWSLRTKEFRYLAPSCRRLTRDPL
ncbi:hypothetical protein BCEP4_1980006 [Burkholderia cepacia]|nr:hypothetical protein BCEP4_1980006 [Burkholderia cepacia]